MTVNIEKWPDNVMTTADRRAFQQICTREGKILVVAMDQRNSMRKLLSNDEKVIASIGQKDLGKIKAGLVKYLGNHAPALLLDPLSAVPMVVDEGILARDVALVVGMDASGYDQDPTSLLRQSKIIDGIDARRVRELGGTAGKLLAFMRADQKDDDLYASKLIKDTVADFNQEDVLLVVEILVYKLPEETEEEYQLRKPDLIIKAAQKSAECGAKVLKLQYPGSAEACAKITSILDGIPWAVLSEGVDHDVFCKQLRIALDNGASGAIAGRSLWKDCVSLDPDVTRERLEKLAVPRLREILEVLKSGK
jgi:tagatose-1,6-bisphosphate aldolase